MMLAASANQRTQSSTFLRPLGLADLARFRIGDPDPLAGIVHERLLASDVMLAHHRRQPRRSKPRSRSQKRL